MKKFIVVSEDNFKTTKLIKLSKDEIREKLGDSTDRHPVFIKDKRKTSNHTYYSNREMIELLEDEKECLIKGLIKEYYWFEELRDEIYDYGLDDDYTQLVETSLEEIFL